MQEEDAELVRRRENEREERERGLWREVERWREGRGEGDEYVFSIQPFLQNHSWVI